MDSINQSLEARFKELSDRIALLECEIKRMRITPVKLIEARAWALVYELRTRNPVNGIISMTSYECADFLENGIYEESMALKNAHDHRNVVNEIMDLASKKEPEVTMEKTGHTKKIWRIILKSQETQYSFNDLIHDYQ